MGRWRMGKRKKKNKHPQSFISLLKIDTGVGWRYRERNCYLFLIFDVMTISIPYLVGHEHWSTLVKGPLCRRQWCICNWKKHSIRKTKCNDKEQRHELKNEKIWVRIVKHNKKILKVIMKECWKGKRGEKGLRIREKSVTITRSFFFVFSLG